MDTLGLSRFGFMTAAIATTAATGLPNVILGQSLPASDAHTAATPFHFDRLAFQAILEQPYPHRQLAIPASYGDATGALSQFQRSIAAYADPDGFAAGPRSVHCAAVLYRGLATFMVLDDAMYAKYPIGLMCDEELRPNDLRYRTFWTALRRNPIANELRAATDQGVSFFVCNNNLRYLASTIAKRLNASGADVAPDQIGELHDELAAHVVPSTMLVPAGVAAIIAAQEARFTYLP